MEVPVGDGALGSARGEGGEETDIDDFDIDRSIAQAWAEFQVRLSEIISMIDDSGDLTIDAAPVVPGAPYVRFGTPRPDSVRCEAAGNGSLVAAYELTDPQQTAMAALGWAATESGNYTAERAQEDSDELAELAVATLRDVYGVQHPVFLAPDQLAEVFQPDPTPIEEVPVLVGDELVPVAPGWRQLNQQVDAELTRLYGHTPIRDAEGDIAIRVGSTMLFLRTAPDGQEVLVFASVVHDVAGRSRAAEVLNDLNVEARWVKFKLVRDRVFVTFSVLSRPFVPAHLLQAVRIVSEVADGIDEELADKLNGRTTFSDRDDPH